VNIGNNDGVRFRRLRVRMLGPSLVAHYTTSDLAGVLINRSPILIYYAHTDVSVARPVHMAATGCTCNTHHNVLIHNNNNM